jgi:anti-sigma-K factor RsiG
VDVLPDLGSLSDEGLKQLIEDLTEQEHQVSYRRRVLHGQIDILRAELVARLQQDRGASVLDHLDVERLSEIIAGKVTPPD